MVRVAKRKPRGWVSLVLGAALVVGLAIAVYRANMQSVDINRIAQDASLAREFPLGKWSFEGANEFGTSGVWRLPAAFKNYNVRMSEGKLVWTGVVSGAQIVGLNLDLDMKEDMTGYGKYVVKVKSELIEEALQVTPQRDRDMVGAVSKPTPPASREFGMKVALAEVYYDSQAGTNKERTLAEQTMTGRTNVGVQDYEFVFEKPIGRKVTRIRYYLYEVEPQVQARMARNRTRLTGNIEEISVVKRYDPRPISSRRPTNQLIPVGKRSPVPVESKP